MGCPKPSTYVIHRKPGGITAAETLGDLKVGDAEDFSQDLVASAICSFTGGATTATVKLAFWSPAANAFVASIDASDSWTLTSNGAFKFEPRGRRCALYPSVLGAGTKLVIEVTGDPARTVQSD